MFGFRYFKAKPTEFVVLYQSGKVKRSGVGLSFLYFAPTSTISKVPLQNMSIPFILTETTKDFQAVTLQGNLTLRVMKPEKLARVLNFGLDDRAKVYESKDPEKLPDQIINKLQVVVRGQIQALTLTEALVLTPQQVLDLKNALGDSEFLEELGLSCLDLSIMAIKPKPETAKALEAHQREAMLQEADRAIYVRRNAAIEQERAIRENELETEHAVEEKKRRIEETKLEAERSLQQKRQAMLLEKQESNTHLEKEREKLVQLAAKNATLEADSRAYGMRAMLKPLGEMDPKTLEALSMMHMNPSQMIAQAFQSMAENSEKIGELNISPDLLSRLLEDKKK